VGAFEVTAILLLGISFALVLRPKLEEVECAGEFEECSRANRSRSQDHRTNVAPQEYPTPNPTSMIRLSL
jgi:hypothetical protein